MQNKKGIVEVRKRNSLWKYRKRMGFTQEYVARLLGHQTTAHVSEWENGRSHPDRINMMKLSIIYRVPSDFLFRDEYLNLRSLIRKKEQRLVKRCFYENKKKDGNQQGTR